MRKQFATSIEETSSEKFKVACDNRGVKMNTVLEAFMEQFANDEFGIKITKNGIELILDK